MTLSGLLRKVPRVEGPKRGSFTVSLRRTGVCILECVESRSGKLLMHRGGVGFKIAHHHHRQFPWCHVSWNTDGWWHSALGLVILPPPESQPIG